MKVNLPKAETFSGKKVEVEEEYNLFWEKDSSYETNGVFYLQGKNVANGETFYFLSIATKEEEIRVYQSDGRSSKIVKIKDLMRV